MTHPQAPLRRGSASLPRRRTVRICPGLHPPKTRPPGPPRSGNVTSSTSRRNGKAGARSPGPPIDAQSMRCREQLLSGNIGQEDGRPSRGFPHHCRRLRSHQPPHAPRPPTPPAQLGRSVRPDCQVGGRPTVSVRAQDRRSAGRVPAWPAGSSEPTPGWPDGSATRQTGRRRQDVVMRRISSQKRSRASAGARSGKTFCAQAGVGSEATFHCCFISIIDSRHGIMARYSAV